MTGICQSRSPKFQRIISKFLINDGCSSNERHIILTVNHISPIMHVYHLRINLQDKIRHYLTVPKRQILNHMWSSISKLTDSVLVSTLDAISNPTKLMKSYRWFVQMYLDNLTIYMRIKNLRGTTNIQAEKTKDEEENKYKVFFICFSNLVHGQAQTW